MGNDGGSIPDRRDLVRNKPKAEQADKANQTRARWFFCALSKRVLQDPIVSCALGKLYNKDAILEYLIDKSAYGDGDEICGHIRSLKDVKTLKLTPNLVPASLSPNPTDNAPERAPYVCPLTLKEMNGLHTFVYLASCGCVFSQAGLKAVTGSSSSTPPADDTKNSSEEKQFEICPQCATKYDKKEDVRVLNPDPEIQQEMRVAMEAQRMAAPPKPKKSKKRKAEASESPLVGEDLSEVGATAKKAKSAQPAPTVNPSITAASRAVVSSLALEEAKRKASMSDAVKSLYKSDNGGRKETFMTRGTFTRYA